VHPAGLRSLASLLADSYALHAKAPPTPSFGRGLAPAATNFGPFAACVVAAHLQLARRLLLMLVSRLEDKRPTRGSASPSLAVIQKRLPSNLPPTSIIARRQAAARQASLAGKSIAVAADGFDFHVDWHKELRGNLRAKLGSGAFGQVYKVSAILPIESRVLVCYLHVHTRQHWPHRVPAPLVDPRDGLF
jgi:hypothetical protein